MTVLESNALPLGMFCANYPASQTVQLEPGDSMLLYTDGLSETVDLSDNEYGEERLVRLVERHVDLDGDHLIQVCLSDLQDFKQEQPAHDDLTMMVVRRVG